MSRAVTVSQINRYIANLFKQDYTLSGIQVKGEISGCKYHYSGQDRKSTRLNSSHRSQSRMPSSA